MYLYVLKNMQRPILCEQYLPQQSNSLPKGQSFMKLRIFSHQHTPDVKCFMKIRSSLSSRIGQAFDCHIQVYILCPSTLVSCAEWQQFNELGPIDQIRMETKVQILSA